MAYTNIDDPSAHFQTVLWSGNASTQSITNDGNSDLKPDWAWTKDGIGYGHKLMDSSRGIGSSGKFLITNSTAAESSINDYIMTFDTNGFSVGAGDAGFNASNDTYVTWQWKANGGTTSSNTDGDLTSTVQFNSTAKFSIITYTGKSPIEPLDIGHGMGEAPDVIIIKNRSSSRAWAVYHKDLTSPAENRYLQLNTTNAEAANSTFWRNEAPTSTIIKTGENASVNLANENFVAYAWKEVQGYSKFGKYVGNGNANGPFIYTGFKPAFVIVKRTTGTGNWLVYDNKGDAFNLNDEYFYANSNAGESTSSTSGYDFLSNGFKTRNTYNDGNVSGQTYIYMAFAENPFVTSTGIPTTAR